MDMKGFVQSRGIKATSVMVDRNPNMIDENWQADHYKVTLSRRNPKRQITVFFSMGVALAREPEAEGVLDCLCSDAASWEDAPSFEGWAADLGYDTDSRRAEKTYNIIERQAARLRAFLGDDYELCLWQIDRG